MSSTAELIERIRAKGANIVLGEDGLRIINRDRLPDEAIDYIRKHRDALVEHLRSVAVTAGGDATDSYRPIQVNRPPASAMGADDLSRLLYENTPEGVDAADWTWFVGYASKIFDDKLAGAAR